MPFFLLQTPAHHSFTFKLRFFYGLRHKLRLSKTVWDFSFSFPFRFCWSLYFCSSKCMDSLTFKCHNTFKIKVIEKPHTFLLPDVWFLLQQKVLKFNDICVSWCCPKLTWLQTLKPRKSKLWESFNKNI